MDNANDRRYIRDKTAARFRGRDKLYAKYIPQIPESAEREYAKISAEYMRIVKEVMEAELPKLKEVYKREREIAIATNARTDAADDLFSAIKEVFDRIQEHITSKCEGYGLRRKLEDLSLLTEKLTVKEWKKTISSTLAGVYDLCPCKFNFPLNLQGF